MLLTFALLCVILCIERQVVIESQLLPPVRNALVTLTNFSLALRWTHDSKLTEIAFGDL